jgi:hypothetical protein
MARTPRSAATRATPAAKPVAINPKPKPKPLPELVVTRNGKVLQRIIAPAGATDIHWAWGGLGGGGYFTKNGVPIPNSVFFFVPGANDWHFSLNGKFGKPVIPPPWANDVEFAWRSGKIVEGWWTRDGHRIESVSLPRNAASFTLCLVDSETADTLYEQDPKKDREELRALLASKTLEKASADLRRVSRTLASDARQWTAIDQKNLWDLSDPFLDVMWAQYELWQIGSDLRVVTARAMGASFGNAREIASSRLFAYSGRPQMFAGRALYDWNDKVTAIANIIEVLTGIPVELLKEYFAAELFEITTLLKKLAELSKDKNNPEYKRLKARLGLLLEQLFNKILGKKFRDWLVKKLGKEAAEKLIEKFAEKLLPVIGWVLVGLEFIALLWIWWEILLDP